jgi:hypothetical protein
MSGSVHVFYEKNGEEHILTGKLLKALFVAREDGYLTLEVEGRTNCLPWERMIRVEYL